MENEKPTISKTEIRQPVEKVAGTCPYHKDCFDECKSTHVERPKPSKTEIRTATEKQPSTSPYHKACLE